MSSVSLYLRLSLCSVFLLILPTTSIPAEAHTVSPNVWIEGDVAAVRNALGKIGDVNALYESGQTPLSFAARYSIIPVRW